MKDLTIHLNEAIFKGNINRSPYEAVDLGLSVKWCSCNVGANKPEDPGLLFQWGRTDGYLYDSETRTSFNKGNGLVRTDENPVTNSGNKYTRGNILLPEDDAAQANMKGKWRMPTNEELEELLELQHEKIKINNITGIQIHGKNKNTLFIPCAGIFDAYFGDYLGFNDNIERGYLWSSSVTRYNNDKAYMLEFGQYDEAWVEEENRYLGASVRGVCE